MTLAPARSLRRRRAAPGRAAAGLWNLATSAGKTGPDRGTARDEGVFVSVHEVSELSWKAPCVKRRSGKNTPYGCLPGCCTELYKAAPLWLYENHGPDGKTKLPEPWFGRGTAVLLMGRYPCLSASSVRGLGGEKVSAGCRRRHSKERNKETCAEREGRETRGAGITSARVRSNYCQYGSEYPVAQLNSPKRAAAP